jgi:hypothetical protein
MEKVALGQDPLSATQEEGKLVEQADPDEFIAKHDRKEEEPLDEKEIEHPELERRNLEDIRSV